MNYSSRMEYGKGLSNMFNWTQTTYLRGDYKFTNSYVDRLCESLVGYPSINGVFASIEKDKLDSHNHLHLLLSSKHKINRYMISKLSGFNSLGIGNVDNIKNNIGVSKYVAKHIGKDFSYHNIYV